MSEQPKNPFQNSNDEVPSAEATAATELAVKAEAAGADTDSIETSPQTPAQPALKLASPPAAKPAAPHAAAPVAPRAAAPVAPRAAAAPTPATASSIARPSAAPTEEASISVPILIIDAIAAAVAIAFTVLLLQDLSPFLN